ncbi:MAG TPA: SigE family RNA polymerase sigma factor [Marmoricola sp.]
MRDEAEFVEWASTTQQRLYATAYLLCGDAHRAEDLVQEGLSKVALKWRSLQHGNPGAYARRVIVNANISWWRKHRRERLTDPPGQSAPAADVETAMVVQRALQRLTERQRAVLVLRHFDDLSVEETARVLGVSAGTVKSQTHAALERLRTGAPELLDLMGGTR